MSEHDDPSAEPTEATGHLDSAQVAAAFDDYRECLRHTWNTYFQSWSDGWHAFIGVEQALLNALIFERLGVTRKTDALRSTFVRSIRVEPRIPAIGSLSCFAAGDADRSGHTVKWREVSLRPGGLRDARFVEFFDWANQQDRRDFALVRCRVIDASDPSLEDADLLIDYRHVEFTFESPRRA